MTRNKYYYTDCLQFVHFVTIPTAVLSTEADECDNGQVRLANFTDYPDGATRQGTIQICINSAWGTVCGDDLFDVTDAEVFCDQLEGFQRDG